MGHEQLGNRELQCPLCASRQVTQYHSDKKRDYVACQNCHLVFVPKQWHLTAAEEKAEYDKHDNSELSPGYKKFLSKALLPLAGRVGRYLGDGARGLDFGCGEGAFLSAMAAENNLQLDNYDLYYHPGTEVLQARYDYIVMTEVLEHIAQPGQLIPRIESMLQQRALLLVMTKRVIDQERFANWHYKQDPTHICFYSIDTFEWLAKEKAWQLEVVSDDVVVFYRGFAPVTLPAAC